MNLDKFELIFWDFDGVIKESVSVKTDAFVELFQSYGKDVCNKVKQHHIENGGMSRFNKIPLYLEWSNIAPTNERVDDMCAKFSGIVKNKVINSAWVPGVERFLRSNIFCCTRYAITINFKTVYCLTFNSACSCSNPKTLDYYVFSKIFWIQKKNFIFNWKCLSSN